MGVLSKLFGPRKPVRKGPPEHSVIVHFFYGSTNLQHVYALEDLLRIAISEAAAGEYDGHEVAEDGSDGFYYMYGPDEKVLYRVISPLLVASSFMHGARVTLRFGPPKRENAGNRAGLCEIQGCRRLSAAGVHLKMRILTQLFDADEHAAMTCSCAQFGAAVAAPSPD
jgi:hypothetical protein